jgi:hypothetical protein
MDRIWETVDDILQSCVISGLVRASVTISESHSKIT